MEDNNLFVLMGAMVEISVAEKFKKQLGKVKADDAIRMFICQVADGNIKVEDDYEREM